MQIILLLDITTLVAHKNVHLLSKTYSQRPESASLALTATADLNPRKVFHTFQAMHNVAFNMLPHIDHFPYTYALMSTNTVALFITVSLMTSLVLHIQLIYQMKTFSILPSYIFILTLIDIPLAKLKNSCAIHSTTLFLET